MARTNPLTPDCLVLDFDSSVLPLPGETRIDLTNWQEEIRFGCRMASLQKLAAELAPALTSQTGTIFMGSGDYHHITLLLLERYRNLGEPLQIVVFDNHPDNMRYPFGVHCGSWVYHASRLPFVAQIHVLGITSTDVEVAHGWENHLRALKSGKVRYWCVGRNLSWMRWLGISQSQSFATSTDMLSAFSNHIASTSLPIYLSVDKDVLSPEDAHTNWDQGVMRFSDMQAAIAGFRNRIIASDVTGEVSVYNYQSRFKQLLSGLDGQPSLSQKDLLSWQIQHHQINEKLMALITTGAFA